MIPAYYNEIDPYAAQWLRNLITAGLIPKGDVDERSIKEVHPTDLFGYGQCHFFAGIGGWALAARLALWPDDKPIWTGSCPCQPFSVAGKRGGTEDERHLWPEFARLISQCKPTVVFGEQVASKDGRQWLNGVRLDLEALGYAVGAADMCAASVGAPHIRQRLFWLGYSKLHGSYDSREFRESKEERGLFEHKGPSPWVDCDVVTCADGKTRPIESGTFPLAYGVPGRVGRLRAYGNAIVPQVAAEIIAAHMTSLNLF